MTQIFISTGVQLYSTDFSIANCTNNKTNPTYNTNKNTTNKQIQYKYKITQIQYKYNTNTKLYKYNAHYK